MDDALLGVIIALAVILGLIGLVFLTRWYMQGGKYKKDNRIDGKIVIVTGANGGIGKETVRELARRGGIIYMACRDMKKAEEVCAEIIAETGNKNVYCRHLDLASLESVCTFVQGFRSECDRLDILINNAGVTYCPLMRTEEGFEMQIGVNHMGHFLLTNLLLDLLRQLHPSRIVVVSSLAHKWGKIKVDDLNSEVSYDRYKAYNQSKLANILFTRELCRRLKGTGITVNALHPGVVDTGFGRYIKFFNNCCGRFFLRPLMWPFLKTPQNGAQTTICAAIDPELELVSGVYLSDCKIKKVAKHAKDDDMARWLWEESERWTNLPYFSTKSHQILTQSTEVIFESSHTEYTGVYTLENSTRVQR